MNHAKTDAELFEKTSDENLILFYNDEIKRIDEGEKAKDLLSIRVTKKGSSISVSSCAHGRIS